MGILPSTHAEYEALLRTAGQSVSTLDPNSPVRLAIQETKRIRDLEVLEQDLTFALVDVLQEEMRAETEKVLGASRESVSIYKAAFAKFKDWCLKERLPSLPTLPAVVAHYVVARADAGDSIKTISNAVTAIRFIHALYDQSGHERVSRGCNLDEPVVRAALAWARKVNKLQLKEKDAAR